MTLQVNGVGELIALIVILIVQGCILYLSGYIKRKSHNEAEMEDIKKLTTLVEEAKRTFTSNIEILKSNLSLQGNQKFSISTAEREAIFEYQKTYSTWLHHALKLDHNIYSNEEYDKFSELIEKFETNYFIAVSHMQLFYYDEDSFNDLRDEIIVMTRSIVNTSLLSFQSCLTNQLKIERHQITNKPIKSNDEIYLNLLAENVKIIKTFMAQHAEQSKPLNHSLYIMNEKLNSFIKKAIEEENKP